MSDKPCEHKTVQFDVTDLLVKCVHCGEAGTSTGWEWGKWETVGERGITNGNE